MDVSRIIESLNDAQREAVCAPQDPLLVLAGAGSGKTRVLVHRIAWLIDVEGLSPYAVLAVTFTNKAAGEMRARIEAMINAPASGMWVGTFHGLAHRLLRSHWQEAGLPQGFQILDSQDQLRLVKRAIQGLELDEAKWPPKQMQWFINGCKDEGRRPQHIEHRNDPYLKRQLEIYAAYEAATRHTGQPTIILAKTVKGFGLGQAGEGQNVAHQQKKMDVDALRAFRDRFNIPVSDKEIDDVPYYKPPADSEELEYLHERRKALGGYLPSRRKLGPSLPVPALELAATWIARLTRDSSPPEATRANAPGFMPGFTSCASSKSIGSEPGKARYTDCIRVMKRRW